MICVHKAALFGQTAEDTGALLQKIQNRSQIFYFILNAEFLIYFSRFVCDWNSC